MGDNNSAFDHPLFETKKLLRLRAIAAFDCRCQHCHGEGDDTKGPDNRPWHLDRIKPGAHGGEYVEHNVTLLCSACNCSKGGTFERYYYDIYQCLAERESETEYDRWMEEEDQKKHGFLYGLKKSMGQPANDNPVCLI